MDYDEFEDNHLVQDGVIRQIQIIGEAAKRVSAETAEKYTDVPWKDVKGMRDKLIHHYFGVDLEVVWDTVEKDIPNLKKALTEND